MEADGTVPPAWAAALIQQLQAQVAEQAATQSEQMQAQLDRALASLAQAQEGGTATATATVLQAAEAEAAPAAVAAAATEAELREWLAAEGGLGHGLDLAALQRAVQAGDAAAARRLIAGAQKNRESGGGGGDGGGGGGGGPGGDPGGPSGAAAPHWRSAAAFLPPSRPGCCWQSEFPRLAEEASCCVRLQVTGATSGRRTASPRLRLLPSLPTLCPCCLVPEGLSMYSV